MSKARDLANLISTGNALSDGAISVSEISDLTATAAELNKLDGVTATTAELNHLVGATSSVQTQLDNISVTSGSLTKTFTQNETAEITLSQSITSAPVVSVVKEIPQTNNSTKGTWDVNSTASNYTIHNTAYSVTLTPDTVAKTITLGSGSWASTDVGKRVQGNGGDVVIVSVSSNTATYNTTNGTNFTNNNAIASGSWTMEGLMSAGDTAGLSVQKRDISTTTYGSTFRVANYNESFDHSSNVSTPVGLTMARDGSHFYICKQSYGIEIYSTQNDFWVSNSSHVGTWTHSTSNMSNFDVEANDDGTRFFTYVGNNVVKQYDVTGTAWRPDTGVSSATSYTLTGNQTGSTPSQGGAMQFANNGLVLYLLPNEHKSGNQSESAFNKVRTSYGSVPNNTGVVYYFTLTTAYDLSTASYQGYKRVPFYSYASFGVTEDGKWLVNGEYNSIHCYYYPIPTAFDITTIDAQNEVYIAYNSYNYGGATQTGMIATSFIKDHYYVTSYNLPRLVRLPWGPTISGGSTNLNVQNTYNVAVTNTSGQIDSSNFIDINSMTADENVGSATGAVALYAVSTDNRTTWSVAKGTSGIRPIVRNNSGTWQYNSESSTTTTTGDISTGTLTDTIAFDTSSYQTANNIRTFFNNDGTRLYVYGYSNEDLVSYALSTAYDISTKGTHLQSVNLGQSPYNLVNGFGPIWNNDGTKLYYPDHSTVKELAVSTAYDLSAISSSASYTLTPSINGQLAGITWKPDGTRLYVVDDASPTMRVHTYTLTTAWDLSTASLAVTHASSSLWSHSGNRSTSIAWADSGSQLYVLDRNNDTVRRYNLTSAYDVGTATYSGTSNDITLAGGGSNDPCSITIDNNDGVLLVSDYGSQDTFEYTPASTSVPNYVTTPTWTDGTVNDELYTLQQALSVTMNRMDKTQLDAVPDANHFPVGAGTKLDLMIALRVDASTSSVPTSDAVSINYDAATLNEGAVLGTDYDFFFPSNNKVQIKSLAAQNLKVRVV